MSTSARRYIAAILAIGSATVLVAGFTGRGWVGNHPLPFLLLAAGTALAEWLVINFAFEKEGWSFSLVEIAITFGLLTLPAAPLVLAASLGLAIAQVLLRRALIKAAFNVGMYAIATAAAGSLFAYLRSSGVIDDAWGAAVFAMAVFYAFNQFLLGTVVAFAGKQSLKNVLKVGAPILLAVWMGCVALGILAQHLALTSPKALLVFAFPVLLSYIAYRAWIQSKGESQKMRYLYEAGATLITNLENSDGLSTFLRKTSRLFRAGGAQILSIESDSLLKVIDETGKTTIESIPAQDGGGSLIERYVASKSWGSVICVPIVSEVGTTGALLIHSYRGAGNDEPAYKSKDQFPKHDASHLQLLANQASVAIRNVALFDSISEERTKLADIVEHTSDGIYQVSHDRRIMTWNPAMETITGYSAAEAVGQMCFNILRARDGRGADMCSGDCPIVAATQSNCHHNREAEIMTKDGVARWIAYSHSPITDPSGAMTSDVIVVRDVTNQRAAQELKDDFIATVSHELRTPITPIKGFLLTLLRPDVNIDRSEQEKYFKMMLRQAERLERLVEDLLDASRLESGRLTVETGVVDISKLSEQIVDGYRASNPTREFRFSATGANVLARANGPRLEQVICNLFQNALRYTPEDQPIELIIRQEGSETSISVRDRGQGIPYDEQEMVFERFYRSGHHLTREQGGTGLGLFIARKLTEAMEGRLTLSSRFGQGATFTIHLKGVGISHQARVVAGT